MESMRLDAAMVSAGLVSGRDKARLHIKAGKVLVNGHTADKPSTIVGENDKIELVCNLIPFVGRGGLKLKGALELFGIDPRGMRCMDVGASTGGFTDCLLQNGAASVTAVDTGTNQLAESLKCDARVHSMEGTDIRSIGPEHDGCYSLVAIDVSFISILHVLPRCVRLLAEQGRLICLIKPQFEAGKTHVGKKGVVKNRRTHLDVLARVLEAMPAMGLFVRRAAVSPIHGGDGNIEYLLLLDKHGPCITVNAADLIAQAFDGREAKKHADSDLSEP